MRISECIGCGTFPCVDIKRDNYILPDIDISPEEIKLIIISEASPADLSDYYFSPGNPHFQQTTLLAFQDAGTGVNSFEDILDLGVYFTTAVKCGKTGYGIKAATIKECSSILEKELGFFPNVQAFMLMGDVAIKAINYIAQRAGQGRAIPAGSTYKIRSGEFYFQGVRAFPSYLQVGPSFNIEKSKRRMIAEDIAAALEIL